MAYRRAIMQFWEPLYIILSVVAVIALIAAVYFYVRHRKFRSNAKPQPLSFGLRETRKSIMSRLTAVFTRDRVDEVFLAELEETLIAADVGLDTSQHLLEAIREAANPEQAKNMLRDRMIALFTQPVERILEAKPRVILVLGVNGVGKTTSIAKLAYRFQRHGERVLLAAGDTFRAAAVEQLKVWGDRLGCEVVAQGIGADAASVAFDSVSKAKAKNYDVVLIDTAGRLHTKHNLMEELKKIDRVTDKAYPGAPHERWLVLDATVGQNGLNQAKQFDRELGLTGIIVTKLDGTAKGGIVCAVSELGIPVISIGVGEGMEDLRPFDAKAYVEAILGG